MPHFLYVWRGSNEISGLHIGLTSAIVLTRTIFPILVPLDIRTGNTLPEENTPNGNAAMLPHRT